MSKLKFLLPLLLLVGCEQETPSQAVSGIECGWNEKYNSCFCYQDSLTSELHAVRSITWVPVQVCNK